MSVPMLWLDVLGQWTFFQTWTAAFFDTWVFQEPQYLAFIHLYGQKTKISLETMVYSFINIADNRGFFPSRRKLQ